jgi:hypothetical protein
MCWATVLAAVAGLPRRPPAAGAPPLTAHRLAPRPLRHAGNYANYIAWSSRASSSVPAPGGGTNGTEPAAAPAAGGDINTRQWYNDYGKMSASAGGQPRGAAAHAALGP